MRKELNPEGCQTYVSTGRGWYSHQCLNKPKVEREGKLYCGVHDPVRLKKLYDEKHKEWEKEWAETEAKRKRINLMTKYFEEVSTEEIEKLVEEKGDKK